MLNGLDLFSGIGGMSEALGSYVWPRAYCENNERSSAILLSRMYRGEIPIAPIFDDARNLKNVDLPPIEIIYAGVPCQDFSIAGRGAGLAGERGRLFEEVLRLVGDIRPAFLFLENVPAIRTRGADVISARLAGLGYDQRWTVIRASEVNCPMLNGSRWFLLAKAKSEENRRIQSARIRADLGANGEPSIPSPDKMRELQPERIVENIGGRLSDIREKVLSPTTSGLPDWAGGTFQRPSPLQEFERSTGRQIERDFRGVAHGVQARCDRIRALGDAVVPAQARGAFERLLGLKPHRMNGASA